MPPKPIAKFAPSSTSKDLVPVGPRHVSAKTRNLTKRNENGDKPTTARALVLRNGKHGARGTGEIMLVTKMSGREKLDLLAEDLVEKSKNAVMSPFRLDQCLKIAESQCNAFLDDITNLRDPELFFHLVHVELNARTRRDSKKSDPLRNPSYVASTVATKIHNTYLLASAWNIVSETFMELAQEGLADKNVKSRLKVDENFRIRYLALYDMVNVLVNIGQAKFSVLATTAPHYARYFKQTEGEDPGEVDFIFDWAELREACVSFLDSIIIELCFPRAPYPQAILYQVLSDAIGESPKEAKRFPQALWDAVGDLSVSVELQQLLEAPLLGPEGDIWRNTTRAMPEKFERWIHAQIYSEKASGEYGNFKDIIYPLEKTKNKGVLENMWKFVNMNYKSVSSEDIDTLWRLGDALDSSPQWHAFYMPTLAENPDYDSDGIAAPTKGARNTKSKKPLAITSACNDSDDSMPELQSVSNSSDEVNSDEDSDLESEDGEDEDDSDDSGYDTEQEDELREMLREAMDTAHEADWLHSANVPPEMDPFLQEDRKGNPFLKLLGSLRGRMFSSNPKLRTAAHASPGPKPTHSTKLEPVSPISGTLLMATTSPKASLPETGKSYKPTIEEVEDEDNITRSPKKKKKKPKKKKKLAASPEPEAIQVSLPPPLPTTKAAPPSPIQHAKKTAPAFPLKPGSSKVFSSQSTTSLSLPVEPTTAQSARAYVQSEGLDSHKTKVKSRPDYATSFTSERKGLFSKIMRRSGPVEEPKKGAKHSWFSRLGKKTKGYMHQLLNTAEDDTKGMAPMKWESFLKVMRDMGFSYEPGTAGSSVRFDPPSKLDKPITFHKPHPDPTLQPIMLKDFAKRLKKQYGWTEEDFMKVG